MSKRTSEHLYRFRRFKKYKCYLYQHLHKHNHNIKYIKVQPLEIINRDLNLSKRQFRRERRLAELDWIKKLQTAYPLGLNDNIMGQGSISRSSNINVMNLVIPRKRNKRSHGKRINRNVRKQHRSDSSITDLIKIFKNNGRHHLFCKLCSIPISKLNSIRLECSTISHASPLYEGALIISSFCYYKLFPKIENPEDHIRHFIKLTYINRGLDFINISSIFMDPNIQDLIPPYFSNTEPPIVSYKYKKPTRNIIFNYTKTTTDEELDTNIPLSCDCAKSDFRYAPCDHVVTGDLSIVNDPEVINFLKKGPKFRPPTKINWNSCLNCIKTSLLSYCKSWIRREGADSKSLDRFINKFMAIVQLRISQFQNSFVDFRPNTYLNRIKSKIRLLGLRYVFVPADKAANNVVVV